MREFGDEQIDILKAHYHYHYFYHYYQLLLLLLLLLLFSFQSQPVAQLSVRYVAVHCTGASRAQIHVGKFRYE